MANIGDLLQFSSNLNIGDWFYSVIPRSAPYYLPLTSQQAPYAKTAYPALGKLLSPDITPVSYVSTNKAIGITAKYWGAIAYGNGVWIATPGGWGSHSQTGGARSTDNGVTWTNITFPAGGWTSVVYGNGVWVAVAGQSTSSLAVNTLCAVSLDDGLTWTTKTLPVAANWSCVSYGNGTFVAVAGGPGTATTAAAISTDGHTWTQRTLPGTVQNWTGVAYGGGVWVAVCTTGLFTAISLDNGITWGSRTLAANYGLVSIAYGNGVFVAIGGAYTGVSTSAIVSANYGNTWTLKTLPNNTNWCSIAYGNGVFVAIAGSYIVFTSIAASSADNGETWSPRVLSTNQYWSSVNFGTNSFLSVANYDSTGATSANFNVINYAVNPSTFTLPVVSAPQGLTAYMRAYN